MLLTITLRLFGVFGIMLATSGLILLRISEKKEKISVIDDFQAMIFTISNLIESKRLCISDIFDEIVNKATESREFFEFVSKNLKSEDNPSLKEVWETGVDFYKEKGMLAPKACEIIKKVGTRLGSVSAEIEVKSLEEVRAELIWQREKIAADFEKESKLLKSLGFALGGFIILIFI